MTKTGMLFAEHRSSSAKLLRPQDLFAKCKADEQKLKELSVRDQVHQALKDYLFVRHPLFAPDLPVSYEQCVELAKQRYPFDFSIIQQGDGQFSVPEWRYKQILDHLKKLKTIEMRLLCIARWLKQEDVCEPEDIMPSTLLRSVLKLFVKKERISIQDLRHWYLVTIWRPYFDRLLDALKAAPKTNRGPAEHLAKQGYEEAAVTAAIGKRSPIPAIASWLEDSRTKVEAHTLENAYSRVQRERRRRRSVQA